MAGRIKVGAWPPGLLPRGSSPRVAMTAGCCHCEERSDEAISTTCAPALNIPQILLLQRAPEFGADRLLALLEGREIGFDAARVAVLLHRAQHPLCGADRGAVRLRRVDAEPESHALQFVCRQHRRLAALEHIDQ